MKGLNHILSKRISERSEEIIYREIREIEMKERVSLTTMSVTYPLDDDNDLPFESANDLTVTWHYVLDPEYDRLPEPDPWKSHDWTNDYDYPDDYSPDDEEFE